MWRDLMFVAVLASSGAHAQEDGPKKEPSSDSRRAEARADEQNRIEALSRRGLAGNYRSLTRVGQVPAVSKDSGVRLNAQQQLAASRVTAIDLAGLGFTPADIETYRSRGTDLFGLVYTMFQRTTSSPADHLLVADNVVIATAGKIVDSRTRIDGFLSATPVTVVKSLKGSRAPGDVVYLPRRSGPIPGGMYQSDSSDIEVTPGKKYLFVLSRNWYEQRVAETKKQPESNFTALPFLAYEISGDGKLLPRPRPTLSNETPKDIQAVEAAIRNASSGSNGMGGRRER